MIARITLLLVFGGLSGCASTNSPAGKEAIAEFRSACIDIAPILGDDFVDCGTFEPVRGSHVDRRGVAMKCALRAQQQGRAFIYHYIEYSLPDVGVHHLAVFGAHGERLLRQWGEFGEDQVDFAGACDRLTVTDNGYPESGDCSGRSQLIERLRMPRKADDPAKCDLSPVRN